MKRTIAFAAATAVALVAAGLAVAHGLDSGASVRALAGTFDAKTASRLDTRTCTTADGKTIVTTTGVYTGAAAGDADLAGNATLRARSVINTTDNVGVVSGSLRIDVASGRDTVADFSAVYSGGSIAGLAVGRAHDPSARLVANISAGFGSTTGFSGGKIGGGTGAGAAVEVGPGRCQTVKTVPQKSEARGTITALPPGSITVAGLTCTVPPNLQDRVSKLAVNDRAEIHCELVNGTNTLTRVEGKR
jgi:hypothetical protein